MGYEEMREALKTLTKEEKKWMSDNPDHPRVMHFRISASMVSSEGASPYDDMQLINEVKRFKKWFKANHSPTPKNDKNKPQQD